MILGITLALIFIIAIAIVFSIYNKQKPIWEAFDDVPNRFFLPTVPPGGHDEHIEWTPAPAFNTIGEKPIESASLPIMNTIESRKNWGSMTSERCFRTDIGESLKRTRNFLQRTNNYRHTHPDSCSAPNHEFVGTFYTPFDGVGNKPSCGINFPKSTRYCNK